MECSRPETFRVSESLPTHRKAADPAALIRRTYEDDGHVETIRSGFEPTQGPTLEVSDFAIGDDDDRGEAESSSHENEEARRWQQSDHVSTQEAPVERSPTYGSLHEEHVWSDGSGHKDDTS